MPMAFRKALLIIAAILTAGNAPAQEANSPFDPA
jgi:hypothetical protein